MGLNDCVWCANPHTYTQLREELNGRVPNARGVRRVVRKCPAGPVRLAPGSSIRHVQRYLYGHSEVFRSPFRRGGLQNGWSCAVIGGHIHIRFPLLSRATFIITDAFQHVRSRHQAHVSECKGIGAPYCILLEDQPSARQPLHQVLIPRGCHQGV